MAESQKSEKRTHFRGKARPGRRIDLTYRTADGELYSAVTRNIGVGGAFILTDTPEAAGASLSLQLQLPNVDNPIVVDCEVRWSTTGDESGMGVKFENIDVEALLALNEYFASLTGTE
jgi:uncharacterized protein (TIGR02266 family)